MAPPMTFKGFLDLQGGGAAKPRPARQAPPILPLPTQGAKLPGGFGPTMPPATTAFDVLNILTQLAGTPVAAPTPPAVPPPLARPPDIPYPTPGAAPSLPWPAPPMPPLTRPPMPPLGRPPTAIPRNIPLPTQDVDFSSIYGRPGVPTPTAWGSDVEQVWSLTGYEPATAPPSVPYPTQRRAWPPVLFIPGTPRPRVLDAANPLLPPPAPRGTATGWLTLGAPPPRVPRWRIWPDRDVARRVSPKWDPVDVVPWRASPTGTPPLLRQPPRRE